MIRMMAADYTVRELCEAFDVSRSGYYAWRQGKHGVRARANAELTERIAAIHLRSRGCYGSPRITHALAQEGMQCGHNRVARLMRQCGLRGVQRGRFRPKTTDSRHNGPIAPNRLKEIPAVRKPNQVWVADITYIPIQEGWAYLAAFMDLGTRTIKGWSFEETMSADLVVSAFQKAQFRYQPGPGLIVHSDRGSQYASTAFRRALATYHALPSMGRRGNCYDNAAMESFWATLKAELRITRPFASKDEARYAIFDYIETFYNRRRLHSAIDYLAPLEYETKLTAKTNCDCVSENSG